MSWIALIAGPPTMGLCTAEGCPSGWITPGDTRSEQDIVNQAFQTLDSDMRAWASPGLVTAWRNFFGGWNEFYTDQGGVMGWLDRFATATSYQKTLDYRNQLDSWRSKLVAEGGQTSGPGLQPPPTDKASGIPDALKYVAITAGILGAVYVVSRTGLLSGLVARSNPARRRRRR